MGYVEETVYVELRFDGVRKDLWIKVREPNTDEWEKSILPLLDYAKEDPHRLTDVFCSLLHSWNLENEDQSPVPLTREGFRGKNIRFTGTVLRAWINNAIVIEEPHESAPTEEPEEVDPFEDINIKTVDLIPVVPIEAGV